MREMSRSVYVSLAHRYWNFDWDRRQNHEVYGRLASPDGIGANLRLELRGGDEPDLRLGTARLKALVDHHALFSDVPEFTRASSTLERITIFLAARHGVPAWRTLTVHEDDRLSCVVDRSGRLTLRERIFNFTLEFNGQPDPESGVLQPRGSAAAVVRELAPNFAADHSATGAAAWAKAWFAALNDRLPKLSALEVALNPRESLRVSGTVVDQIKGDLQ